MCALYHTSRVCKSRKMAVTRTKKKERVENVLQVVICRVWTKRGVGHGLGRGVGNVLPCGLPYGLPVVRLKKKT